MMFNNPGNTCYIHYVTSVFNGQWSLLAAIILDSNFQVCLSSFIHYKVKKLLYLTSFKTYVDYT
jgi:hypothetical protein